MNNPLDLSIRKDSKSMKSSIDYSTKVCMGPGSPRSYSYSPTSNYSDSEASSTTLSAFGDYRKGGRVARPFKAYPKDPLHLVIGAAPITQFNQKSAEAYKEYRDRLLEQVQMSRSGTNENMRRVPPTSNPTSNPMNGSGSMPPTKYHDDPNYWEKRRKNNEAAKRSRDARRAKEDEMAIRCAFLEQENLQLRFQLATIQSGQQRLL